MDYNSLDNPKKISPFEKSIDMSGNKLKASIEAHSVYVFTVPCKKL
jgi:alpha-L-arabinofuranosidase